MFSLTFLISIKIIYLLNNYIGFLHKTKKSNIEYIKMYFSLFHINISEILLPNLIESIIELKDIKNVI